MYIALKMVILLYLCMLFFCDLLVCNSIAQVNCFTVLVTYRMIMPYFLTSASLVGMGKRNQSDQYWWTYWAHYKVYLKDMFYSTYASSTPKYYRVYWLTLCVNGIQIWNPKQNKCVRCYSLYLCYILSSAAVHQSI